MDVSPTIQHFHGRIRSITGTDPAAGAEIFEIVPDRRRWKLIGISFTLVTDVNVADRSVFLTMDDGTNNLYNYLHSNTQAANLSYTYHLYPTHVVEFKIGTRLYAPLPTLQLAPGFRIRTATPNIQAGDNYGAPQMLVEEWIDP